MSDNFIPETNAEEKQVPFYDDVSKEDGWQGHTTTKSIKVLQAEISNSISRLGGHVSAFRKGMFGKRAGFQITYIIDTPAGAKPGRINVAALPIREFNNWDRRHKGEQERVEKSLRMALYMLRTALDGTWFLAQLSPGYTPLMPFMIASKDGKTISELWSDSTEMKNLLPSGSKEFEETDVVDGEVKVSSGSKKR